MVLQRQATFVCGHLSTDEDAAVAQAVPPATLRVGGEVAREQLLTLDGLRALPSVTLTVPDRGCAPSSTTHTCTGVLLRDVLQHAGVFDNATRNNDVCGKSVTIVARDGYCITLAYCDLLIPYSQQRALLAYMVDDISLGDVELILPDDPNACRWVKHVAEIMLGDPRSLRSTA